MSNTIIIISYVTIQVSIALIVSIVGAIHVRQCLMEENNRSNIEQTIEVNTSN